MDALTSILSQYSIESIIIFGVMFLVAVKFVGELLDWVSKKLREYFDVKNDEEEFKAEVKGQLNRILDELGKVESKTSLLQERMQNLTRTHIIDKSRYYTRLGAIDDAGLQDLERHYMLYKEAGGNSYVATLMEDVRELPHISLTDESTVDAILSKERGNA